MKLGLSKLEIKVLQNLCRNPSTVTSLARAMSISKSLVSKVVKQLTALNLVRIERKGTEKVINLSFSSHAEVFRSLYFSRPNAKIENWLSGKTIETLIVIVQRNKATMNELAEECNCSKPTLYKIIYNLKAAGVLSETNGYYSVSDALVRAFAQAFADSIRGVIAKNIVDFELFYRSGKNVLVRTPLKLKHPFYLTGLSRLIELGLQAIPTGYLDYYFNLDETVANISIEGAVVHALLMSREHFDTEKPLITIFIKQNSGKLNWFKLNQLAEKYGVGNKLHEVRAALDLHEKLVEYNE